MALKREEAMHDSRDESAQNRFIPVRIAYQYASEFVMLI